MVASVLLRKADKYVRAALRARDKVLRLREEADQLEEKLAVTIGSFSSDQLLAYGERTLA